MTCDIVVIPRAAAEARDRDRFYGAAAQPLRPERLDLGVCVGRRRWKCRETHVTALRLLRPSEARVNYCGLTADQRIGHSRANPFHDSCAFGPRGCRPAYGFAQPQFTGRLRWTGRRSAATGWWSCWVAAAWAKSGAPMTPRSTGSWH